MEDIKKMQILEDIEKLSKDIQCVVIEKNHSITKFNDKLKILYKKLDQLYLELRRSIPVDTHNDGSQHV